MGYKSICRPKGIAFFLPFWSERRYRVWQLWSQMGCGLCHTLVNWVFISEEVRFIITDSEAIKPLTTRLISVLSTEVTNYETDLRN